MLNNFIDNNLKWVHKPEDFSISNDKVNSKNDCNKLSSCRSSHKKYH